MVISEIQSLYSDKSDLFWRVIKQIWNGVCLMCGRETVLGKKQGVLGRLHRNC